MTLSDPLAGFPAILEVPVAWGDMDAFAHVNNTVFFRWLESARIDYLRQIGFGAGGAGGGVGPILASAHCRFRRPVLFPDTIRVGGAVTEVGADRFTMLYRVISRSQNTLVAEGGSVIVAYDYDLGTKAALPGDVRTRIDALGILE